MATSSVWQRYQRKSHHQISHSLPPLHPLAYPCTITQRLRDWVFQFFSLIALDHSIGFNVFQRSQLQNPLHLHWRLHLPQRRVPRIFELQTDLFYVFWICVPLWSVKIYEDAYFYFFLIFWLYYGDQILL